MSEEEQQTETDSEKKASNVGRVEWLDLTVDDASGIRDFYSKVVGWSYTNVEMGYYEDFNMNLPGSQNTVAGICHARGSNANLPPAWLVYVRVEDVEASADECKNQGGKVLDGPRRMGGSNFCVIQDPAGAVLALLSD